MSSKRSPLYHEPSKYEEWEERQQEEAAEAENEEVVEAIEEVRKRYCCTLFEFKIWILVFILIFRLFVIIWLIANRVFDPLFFTYLNYLVFTLSMIFLLAAFLFVNREMFQFYVLFIFPIVFGTALFVAITIVIMILLNDEIFLARTVFRGGVRTIAAAHSGDWLLHQVPAIEVIIVAACITNYARNIMRKTREAWGGFRSIRYGIYLFFFFTAPAWPLVLYIAVFPFNRNYPVGMNVAVSIFLMLGTTTLISGVLYAIWTLPSRWEEVQLLLSTSRGHRSKPSTISSVSSTTRHPQLLLTK